MAKRANYGVDRPDFIITSALVCSVLLVLTILGIVPPETTYLSIAIIVLVMILVLGGTQKHRVAERILNTLPWCGTETVLDVGCGRGLWLITAAKHLTKGRAVGIDVWNRLLQSGNSTEKTLENVSLEGVSDKVEVKDGDARSLPFGNESFDVVITSLVMHHVPRRQRKAALLEMNRVLKHGGVVVMYEFFLELAQYAKFFRKCGMSDIKLTWNWPSSFFGFRSMQARKP